MFLVGRPHGDFYVLTQSREKFHEASNGKVARAICSKILGFEGEIISSESWRIQPEDFFDVANPLAAEVIQIEHLHGRATNRNPSFHFTAFESEVFRTTAVGRDETRAPARLSRDQRLLSCRLYAGCIRGTLRRGFLEWTRHPSIAG